MDQADTAGATDVDAAADNVAWQRSTARASMLLMATLSAGQGGDGVALRVRNLSAGGLMGDCDRGFAEGEAVCVSLRGVGEVDGIVAWCEGGRIGIRFDRTIDPEAARKPVAGRSGSPKLLVSSDSRRPGLR